MQMTSSSSQYEDKKIFMKDLLFYLLNSWRATYAPQIMDTNQILPLQWSWTTSEMAFLLLTLECHSLEGIQNVKTGQNLSKWSDLDFLLGKQFAYP